MFSSSIFKENEFIKFKQAIKLYCDSQGYHDIKLSDDEITQLSWYMGGVNVTPEVKEQDIIDKFHFEIKRSLARYYSFELVLRGNDTAYQEFIIAQSNSTALSFSDFKKLSEEVSLFHEDVKAAIRASCFLTIISNKAKEVLAENNITLSNDSEEFLSQLSIILIKNPSLFPLTKNLTPAQLNLLPKIFWPNTHLRHMLYTEGGDNMTQTFLDGILAGTFNKQDFVVWKWRWLTNLFGFQGGPGAKFYTAETHLLAFNVISELEQLITQPTRSYLDNYLLKRAEMAGFNKEQLHLSKAEQQLLGHVAAYCHQISILTPTEGIAIYEAYRTFMQEFKEANLLAKLYEEHRKDKLTVTPTYVPAIINNAYFLFKNKLGMQSHEALKNALLFMFQLLNKLYSFPHDKRISCLEFSKETNLLKILSKWLSDHHAYEFEIDEKFELKEKELSSRLTLVKQ